MTGGVKIHDRWKENTPKVEGKYTKSQLFYV